MVTCTVPRDECTREARDERIPVTIVCAPRGTDPAVLIRRMLADHAADNLLIMKCSSVRRPLTVAPSTLVQDLDGRPQSFGRGLYGALRARFGGGAPACRFDRLVVIAADEVNPLPLAQLLCADVQLSLSCRLESIVVLADAATFGRALAEDATARRAVAIADRLVLQFNGLASGRGLMRDLAALRAINPYLIVSREAVADDDDAIVPGASGMQLQPEFEQDTIDERLPAGTVRTHRVEEAGCLDFARTRRWLTSLCVALGDDLYRLRSVCCFRGIEHLVEFQGFGTALGPPVYGAPRREAAARSLITVTGRGLDPDCLAIAVRRCNAVMVAAEMRRHPGAIY